MIWGAIIFGNTHFKMLQALLILHGQMKQTFTVLGIFKLIGTNIHTTRTISWTQSTPTHTHTHVDRCINVHRKIS